MPDPITMSVHCALNTAEVQPEIRCAGRWLCRIAPASPTATQIAEFIRRRFQLAYGATPALRLPELLALTTAQGSVLAAVGVRDAARERLFLEDYLQNGVEARMPEAGLERRFIAEIAHLAGVEAGISRYLFASLSVWLKSAGFRWVVFTGTDRLHNSFRRLGITTHRLAEADPALLADQGIGWGRYYEQRPKVLAVSVAESLAALDRVGLLKVTRPVSGREYSAMRGAYGHTA